ncbi:glycosyltransferase family 4 protein [Rouxiella sp. Mn2063]|uniref:glycosyltransferase family 4 protein n=1 Tax=Rouxiella sp. Mn2063 TaxID=3395262 RepID=UPI003BD5BBA6
MKKIVFDKRWEGSHGIGRFSSEITKRIKFDKYIDAKVKPTSPIDIFVTPWYLFFNRSIYFTPGFNAPWLFVKRSILTVHDLNHVDTPGNSSFLKKIYYNLVLKRGCRKSLAIFTVSEFSKTRIVDWSGVDRNKVVVVGNGVSSEFSPDGPKYQPGYKYILCVSNRKEHKNEVLLIRAFAKIARSSDVKLVFSGSMTPALSELVDKLGIKKHIVFTGFIKDSELPNYYRGATALIMPSLYEGFGLPVIEAMACGIPTIASSTTSLGEIAAGASLLVDPTDIDDISQAIAKIVTNAELRKELSEKGLEHVKQFTWDNTVRKIEEVVKRSK